MKTKDSGKVFLFSDNYETNANMSSSARSLPVWKISPSLTVCFSGIACRLPRNNLAFSLTYYIICTNESTTKTL